jgi:hypothetical protein
MGKSKKVQRREERERLLRREIQQKRQKMVAIVAIAIAILVAAAILTPKSGPDYVRCFGGSQDSPAQHFHPWVFVQIGDDQQYGADFIRLPDNMGVRPSCMWPVHVHEGQGMRGFYFTMLHVESTYSLSEHAYTLGDLMESWGEWLGASPEFSVPSGSLYLGPDGVSHTPSDQPTYRGSTEVRIGHNVASNDTLGPWNPAYNWTSQPASRGIVMHEGDYIHIWVHGDFSL